MLTSEKIKEYRKIAKRIGIWDKDYSTIKQELMGVLSDIRNRDYALDVLGGCLNQIVLIARMVVYGESVAPLSDEDLKTLLSPMEELESLINVPYILSSGIETAIKDVLPIMFKVANKSEDYQSFEKEMRMAMALPSHVTASTLSYGIAIGTCLRRYSGMDVYLEPLIDHLRGILGTSDKTSEIMQAIEEHDSGDSIENKAMLFAALFATAATDCNIKDNVTYDDMYNLIEKIDKISENNKDMHDFMSRKKDFKFFTNCIEKYHDNEDK
jgi:hypothetical protein